jgi:prevent-host-death family protein
MATWPIQEAQRKLSELIDRALSEGPQVITRHGVEVVVVMSITQYKSFTASKQRMGDFLLSSPLHKSGLIIERDRDSSSRDGTR